MADALDRRGPRYLGRRRARDPPVAVPKECRASWTSARQAENGPSCRSGRRRDPENSSVRRRRPSARSCRPDEFIRTWLRPLRSIAAVR